LVHAPDSRSVRGELYGQYTTGSLGADWVVHCLPACAQASHVLSSQACQRDETCKKSDFRFQVWFVYAVEATVASAE